MSDQPTQPWETRREFCPWCRQESLIRLVHWGQREYNFSAWENLRVGDQGGCYYLGECRRCRNPLLFKQAIAGPDEFPDSSLEWPRWGFLHSSATSSVQAIYGRAFAVQKRSPSAYITQIRRALEALLDDLAVPSGSLAVRVQAMRRNGTLPAPLLEAADLLRRLGNAATHHGAEDISYLYTHVANNLFRALVDYAYGLPQSLDEARAALDRLRGEEQPTEAT